MNTLRWLRVGCHLAGWFCAPRLAFSQAVSSGDWTIYDAQGRVHSIDSACRMTANNIQLLLESVLAGTGIAYGPDYVFGEYIQQGRLIKLLPAYRTRELTLQAAYPSVIRIPFKVRNSWSSSQQKHELLENENVDAGEVM